jgi:O-antigen/teichoic acid export membrane protein
MLLIPLFLSQEQQGYWYLFGSISALSVFADLGFSTIILQFAAHEYAFLYFNPGGMLDGETYNLQKLGSLFRFVIKWLSLISMVVFPIIFIIGIVFFSRDKVLGVYFFPWILYSVGSLLKFFGNSILSFVEGLNKIAAIQKIRLFVAVINTGIVVSVLILGGNIYAAALGILLSSVSILFFLFREFGNILKQLLHISKDFNYKWKKEIAPLFTKYAISWSGGYFTFQIYTPLMHYFHGPVYSGRVGISLALAGAIVNISNIWMYTIVPQMNMLVSKKSWDILDPLFRKRLLLTLGTYLVIIAGLIVFLVLFSSYWIIPQIITRFLPVTSLILLLPCCFMQLITGAWALYLRAHKQEPYVLVSIINALWAVITTYLAGRFLPYTWFFSGYLTCYIWMTIACYVIFKRNKEKWHAHQ